MELKALELKDTIEMMNSADYKERFKAEYMQLTIRAGKLDLMLEKYARNALDFKPACSVELLTAQIYAMNAYKALLEERARIEGIEL